MCDQKNKGIIVIAGASWACGEWSLDTNGHYKISHKGLTQYFTDDGFIVVNLAKPGGTNLTSAERVGNFLQVSSHLDIKHVFVFQTGWQRDLLLEQVHTFDLDLDIPHGYTGLKDRFISRFYYRLSKISQDSGIPINLVGSCSDTIWLDHFSKEYLGVTVACQSLVNLLINHNHRIGTPVLSGWEINSEKELLLLKSRLSSADLELLLNDIDLGHERNEIITKNKQFFWPDGEHANRHAHFILFEFLKQTLSNLL